LWRGKRAKGGRVRQNRINSLSEKKYSPLNINILWLLFDLFYVVYKYNKKVEQYRLYKYIYNIEQKISYE